MADLPPDIMHSPDGVFRAMAWARDLSDADLLHLLGRGKAAHPPSVWVLLNTELGGRGLALPQAAPADPSAGATLAASVDSLIAAQDKKSKESDGALALWVFLGTAIVTLLGLGRLFSLGGIAYLLVGGFLASIVLGLLSYGLRKAVVALLLRQAPHLPDQTLTAIGFVLLAVDFGIMLAISRFVTLALFG